LPQTGASRRTQIDAVGSSPIQRFWDQSF